ncbi:hypothetical protein EYF80_035019 [Liparis tanakae]|uniref:Uncharacterized protein n=1 Tax=Liparis tanakae TaxID=230148 RepID=A0A4Z2GPW9_9TELE|nr:hypothetical protein EYF80_035019 [Liparis tanakae]
MVHESERPKRRRGEEEEEGRTQQQQQQLETSEAIGVRGRAVVKPSHLVGNADGALRIGLR